MAAGGVGYAQDARLSMTMGGWQAISWVLVISAPFLLVPVGWSVAQHGLAASWPAWLAFAYVSLVSQYLAFFAWYPGLALGGIARVLYGTAGTSIWISMRSSKGPDTL